MKRAKIVKEVSNKAWGSVDKGALGRRVAGMYADGSITKAQIKEIYAFVPADAFGKDADGKPLFHQSKAWGPHHELSSDGSIVLNRKGVFAAAQALSGARLHKGAGLTLSAAERAAAESHLRRHYSQDLDEDEMPEGLKRSANLFTSMRGPSGAPWWFSASASAFRAKDKIILSRKCLDVMIERAEAGKGPPGSEELRLLHLPIRLGVRAHSGRVGRWLLETGPWDDTPIARSMRAALDAEPETWCVSVQFKGDGLPNADGVLDAATLWERSIVTLDHAMEPWTSISTLTKRRSNLMDIMTLLRSLLPQAADEMLEGLEEQAKELEAAGVDSRSDIEALAADIAKAAEETQQRAEDDDDEEEKGAEEAKPSLDGLSQRMEALEARFEDMETAIEGLAARQPKIEEAAEEAARASRAAVSTELAEVAGALKLLRGLLDPQGQREGAAAAEGSAQTDEEIAAAIKVGLDAAANVDPAEILYL